MNSFIKIIILLSIFLFFSCENDYKEKHFCKDTLILDKKIIPYFESFIIDAQKHDFNSEHVYCIKYFGLAKSNLWQGQTNFFSECIYVNEKLLADSIGTKFVVYHEIGHWLGLEHTNGIMQPSYSSKYHSLYIQENWEILLNDYFIKIKETKIL